MKFVLVVVLETRSRTRVALSNRGSFALYVAEKVGGRPQTLVLFFWGPTYVRHSASGVCRLRLGTQGKPNSRRIVLYSLQT